MDLADVDVDVVLMVVVVASVANLWKLSPIIEASRNVNFFQICFSNEMRHLSLSGFCHTFESLQIRQPRHLTLLEAASIQTYFVLMAQRLLK